MESKYIIYQLTNKVNQKIYFGYTSQKLKTRIQKHIKETRNTIISRSLRKYGINNFKIETLYEFESEHEAKTTEIFLIAFHKSNIIKNPQGNGMNMTDGGEGASGYKHSIELRKQWSKDRKGTPSSRLQFNELNDPLNKKVYQFTKSGKLIKIYPSVKIAARETNSDTPRISRCCRGVNKTTGGYIFQYTPLFDNRNFKRKTSNFLGSQNHRSKKCFLHDNEGNITTSFDSIGELSRKTGLNRSTANASALNGKRIYNNRYLVYY